MCIGLASPCPSAAAFPVTRLGMNKLSSSVHWASVNQSQCTGCLVDKSHGPVSSRKPTWRTELHGTSGSGVRKILGSNLAFLSEETF